MKHSSVLSHLSLLLAMLSLTGCVAVLAGGAAAGTVAYIRGDLQAVIESNINRTGSAVQRAAQDLELIAVSDAKDQTSAKYIFRTATDRKVEVNLKHASDSTTNLSIRVGVFGDETLSRQFYDRIRARL